MGGGERGGGAKQIRKQELMDSVYNVQKLYFWKMVCDIFWLVFSGFRPVLPGTTFIN